MSDARCEVAFPTVCECHKKLEQYGIPIYVRDENEYYSEGQTPIAFETAFRLPKILKINDEVMQYLKVEDNTLSTVFHHMAEVFPALRDFEDNVLSFWILDVLIEGLCTAQKAKMSFAHQKATLMWIAYFFNYILKENPSRQQLFYHLKELLLHKDEILEEGGETPGETVNGSIDTPLFPVFTTNPSLILPPILYKNESSVTEEVKESSTEESTTTDYDESEEGTESLQEEASVKSEDDNSNITDMKVILEILYRIFARINVYLHIQTVFNKMPSVEEVTLPFVLHPPKLVKKPKIAVQTKVEKVGKRISSCEKPCEETLSEKELNNYILPLEAAEEARDYVKHTGSERSAQWRNNEKQKK